MPAGTGAQKRIRDLQRLIKKAGNDQELVTSLQQKIQEVNNEKAARIDPDQKKKHETKYHLVKFVERKKLTRMIQRVMRQLETAKDANAAATLEAKLESLKDDLCYVMYYPVDMKYVALFAKQSKQRKGDQNDSDEEDREANKELQQNAADDVRAEMDPKEAALSNRARAQARAARQREMNIGRDRVQYAVDVHIHGGKKAAEMSKNSKPSPMNGASTLNSSQNTRNITDTSSAQRQSKPPQDNKKADSQIVRNPPIPAVKEVDATKKRKHNTDGSDSDDDSDDSDDSSTSSSSSSSSSGSSSSSSSSSSTSASEKETREHKSLPQPPAKRAKTDQSASVLPPAPPVAAAVEADGFFLEEVADAPPVAFEEDSYKNRHNRSQFNNFRNNNNSNNRHQGGHQQSSYQHVKEVVNRKKYRTHKNLKVRGEKKFG